MNSRLMFLQWLVDFSYVFFMQKLCKEEDSLETMLENVIVLKQVLETAADTPSTNEPEPTLPAPETLGAQFKNRYQICLNSVMRRVFHLTSADGASVFYNQII